MKEEVAGVRGKKVKRNKISSDSTLLATNGSIAVNDSFIVEEAEAEKRNSDKDFGLFKDTCGNIKQHLKNILQLQKDKGSEAEVSGHQVQTSMLFLELKKLNRLDKHRCKKIRDAVNVGKTKVDNFHLQLQNLLYEVMHLEKEVTKCLEFRSKDEDIDLIPVNQFYKEAPANISRVNDTKNDPHQQTLARLEWELEQRERLSAKLQDTESLKHVYLEEIDKKRDCLDSLLPTLRTIIESSQPLHSELGVPLQASQLKHKMAEYLPRPLYVLYVQANAYKEACDSMLSVEIEGNVDEAKIFQNQTEEIEEDSGDSDQEEQTQKKRHRHSLSEKKAVGSKKILAKHPLYVTLNVKSKGEVLLSVQFSYLIHLHVVTSTVSKLQTGITGSFAVSEMLEASTLLDCLFPNDKGKESPNPANHFALRKMGTENFESFVSTVGYPYLWVQKLAGLEFILLEPSSTQILTFAPIKKQHTISASSFEKCITSIRERLISRVILHQQLVSLEQKNIPVPPELIIQYPSKVCARFKDWTRKTWEDVLAHSTTKQLLDVGLINDDATIYRATFERGSAKLMAFVLLSPDYPKIAPVFILTLHWKGEKNSHTESGLMEMERDINLVCVEQSLPEHRNHLLACQLQQLLVSFDIYLETDGGYDSFEGPREFPQTWAFTRTAMGRNRSRPYKFIQKQGLFTQR